jgi:ABC-2 type transport system ATP-binding protein
MMTQAIAMRSVSKVYRTALETKVGLHDLSLLVPVGSFTALVGPNGAGKSSAIKIVATLTRPTTGEVRVFGHDTVADGANVRRQIGYAGQETSTDMYATVNENIRHHAAMYGVPTRSAVARAAELLDTFGLRKQSSMEVRRLSGGQRRRLDIAMALVHQPRLLILDEPTANLDPDARRRVWETLRALRARQELTILFSTHYLEEADDYADQVALVNKGCCVTNGTPQQLKAELGGESLVLDFGDGAQAMRAAQLLQGRASDAAPLTAGTRVIVPCSGARQIHALLDQLTANAVVPTSVTLSQPSLDDVYIRLTGASFEVADLAGQQAQLERKAGAWAW